jgi:hypothetical protein
VKQDGKSIVIIIIIMFCAHLHYSIFKALGSETTHKRYTHTHTHARDVTVLCNQAVHRKRGREREVTANRTDIIIENQKQKTCTLVDVATPAHRNVVQKEAEKKLKYNSLGIEIQRLWN